MNRIKPKNLPLELDKPKFNNTRQGKKSQIFLKGFINKCKNEQKNTNYIINDISNNIAGTNQFFKNESINIFRKIMEEELNHAIDKEIFLMENPRGKREKTIILKGPPMKGENKYLFENKNNALLIGEVISKMDEDFSIKCKEVVESRLIILNEDQIRKKKFKEEVKMEKIIAAKIDEIHLKIEKACEKIEKTRLNALKGRESDTEN